MIQLTIPQVGITAYFAVMAKRLYSIGNGKTPHCPIERTGESRVKANIN